MTQNDGGSGKKWTFLTPYGHVLLIIAESPKSRVRDVAEQIGLTERATQGILRELVIAGYLHVSKEGRRNVYQVQADLPLRHPRFQHHKVAEMIESLSPVLAES